MGTLLIIRHLLFIIFFVVAGIWWIALLPLLGGVGLLLFASPKKHSEQATSSYSMRNFFEDHTITVSWIMIMVGLWGLLDVIAGGSLTVVVRLVGINLLLWLGSYLFGYRDGREVFHYGRYFSSILLLVSLARIGDYGLLLDSVVLWFCMTMAIYAFIVFVIGAVDKTVGGSLHYPLFITFNCCILYLIYYYTQQNIGLSLVGAQAYLLVVYTGIWHVLYDLTVDSIVHDDEDDLFRHILSGQSITRFKRNFVAGPVELYNDIKSFLVSMSGASKSLMGLINTVLVFGQTALFIYHMRNGLQGVDYVWFWGGVLLFFTSFILLRSIGFAYKIQRVVAFSVLNVALYLTIVALFGNNVVYIVGLGILWTIFNSVLIVQRRFFDRKGVLHDEDVFYRIIGTVVTSLCNIYFMLLLPVSFQLIFSLVCFYVGVQVFLVRYSLQGLRFKK